MTQCKVCDGDLEEIGSIQCGLMHDKYQCEWLLRKYKLSSELWKSENAGQIRKWIKWFKGAEED